MKTKTTAAILALIAAGSIGLAGCGGDSSTEQNVQSVVSEGVSNAESVGEDIATGAEQGSEAAVEGVESVGEAIGNTAEEVGEGVVTGVEDGASGN